MTSPARSLLWVAFLVFAACSSDEQNGLGPVPDQPDAPAGSIGGGETPHGVGKIFLTWSQGRAEATALFSPKDTLGQMTPCRTTIVGVCSVSVCPDLPDTGDEGHLGRAGVVTITGGSTAIEMEPSDFLDGQYDVTDGGDATFATGASVSVSATGDEVPAFGARTVQVPADIVPAPLPEVIDFGKDLAVSWTGGGADGKVVVELQTDDGQMTGDLTCSFAPRAGAGTVPAAALGLLPACAVEGDPCPWIVTPRDIASFIAGDYAVDFTVNARGALGMFQNP